jgi:beta-lactamase regulating signal transducer with metallopeptidase domain
MNTYFLSQNNIKILTESLLHSFWQFSLIAILAVLVINLYKVKPAKHRYSIYLASLVICGLSFLGTLFYLTELNPNYTLNHEVIFTQLISSSVEQTKKIDYPLVIVLFWIGGIILLSLKLIISLSYTYVKVNNEKLLNEDLSKKLEVAKTNLGINKKISVFENHKISSPLTYGWLKPIILFPIGWVNQLTTEEVEQILLHEIAHIIRYDFIVNIVVAIINTLFYYHPAIWILNKKLNFERELACDEMVIKLQSNPLSYSKTLVKISEMSIAKNNGVALSFAKNKSELFKRIENILGVNNNNFKTDKLFSLAALAILVLVLSASSIKQNKDVSNQKEILEEVNIEIDIQDNGSANKFIVSNKNEASPAFIHKDTFPNMSKFFEGHDADSIIARFKGKFNFQNGENIDLDELLSDFDFDFFENRHTTDSLLALSPLGDFDSPAFKLGDSKMFFFDKENMGVFPESLQNEFNIDSSNIKIELENGIIRLNGEEIDQVELNKYLQKFNQRFNLGSNFNFPEDFLGGSFLEFERQDTSLIKKRYDKKYNDSQKVKIIKEKRLRSI